VVVAAAVLLASCASSPAKTARDPFLSGSPDVTTSGPVQVLVEGDSLALTLGFGLASGQTAYDLNIVNQAHLGCGVATGHPISIDTGSGEQVDNAWNPGDFLSGNPPDCSNWPTLWAMSVSSVKPDVVVLLVGRWEIVNRVENGQWTDITQPSYQSFIQAQLEKAVSICAARGARVVLMTMPYLMPTYTNGVQDPETLPTRVDDFNAIVRKVAALHRSWVTLFDLNRALDPNGVYTSTVDGVVTRIMTDADGNPDGSHISVTGAQLIAPQLDPLLKKLGLEARQAAA
jgi:lysophospholipase L1-like esterase